MLQTQCDAAPEAAPATNVREIVRFDIARLAEEVADPAFDPEPRIATLTDRRERVQADMRARRYDIAAEATVAAAGRLGVSCALPLAPELGRAVSSALKMVTQVELEVCDEGDRGASGAA